MLSRLVSRAHPLAAASVLLITAACTADAASAPPATVETSPAADESTTVPATEPSTADSSASVSSEPTTAGDPEAPSRSGAGTPTGVAPVAPTAPTTTGSVPPPTPAPTSSVPPGLDGVATNGFPVIRYFEASKLICDAHADEFGNPRPRPERYVGVTIDEQLDEFRTVIVDGLGTRLVIDIRPQPPTIALDDSSQPLPPDLSFGCPPDLYVGTAAD